LNTREASDGLVERECERLARYLLKLGDARVHDPANWDLRLSDGERGAAQQVIREEIGPNPFIVLCIGTKLIAKDWGLPNWKALVDTLLKRYPHRLVFVGAASDRAPSAVLAENEPHRLVNLCGRLQVRESAALIAQAALFIGNDSGPMHLAAAVGTPLVAIFANLAPPGKWFPLGKDVRVLYPGSPGGTIMAITPAEVMAKIESVLPSKFSAVTG